MRRRKPLIALACAALLALALGLSACGGDDDDSAAAETTTQAATTAPATPVPTDTTSTTAAAGGASTVDLQADASGQLKFQETTLSADAGKITIDFSNPSAVPHNVAVDGASGVSETVQDGGTSTLTVDLPAGTYQYYCDVPGHREAGMVGTLTVK